MTLPLNTNNFPDPGGHVFTGLEACECSDDVMRTESLRSSFFMGCGGSRAQSSEYTTNQGYENNSELLIRREGN